MTFVPFTGSQKKPHVAVSHKVCGRCRKDKPASAYGALPKTTTGLRSVCRQCEAEQQRVRKAARLAAKRREKWKRMERERLVGVVQVLLDAAEEAAHAGAWHGHRGLRAYRDLRSALRRFNRELEVPRSPTSAPPGVGPQTTEREMWADLASELPPNLNGAWALLG